MDHAAFGHHLVTLETFSGATRETLDAFVAGASRATLPALLELCVRFRFLPTSERTAEANFSRVSLGTTMRTVTPAYISVRLRTPQWEEELARDPSLFADTLKAFTQTRRRRDLARLLGLDAQPDIAADISRFHLKVEPGAYKLISLTARHMYSAERCQQFRTFMVARKANRTRKTARAKAHLGLRRPLREPPTWERVQERAILQHVRAVCQDGFVYSMRADIAGAEIPLCRSGRRPPLPCSALRTSARIRLCMRRR